MTLLRRDHCGACSGERRGEMRERAEVGVKLDALNTPYPERREPVLVLEPPEASLYSSAAGVEVAEPLAFARNARVQAGRLAPDGLRLALPCRAAPLRPAALEVGPGERPDAMFAGRGEVLPALIEAVS